MHLAWYWTPTQPLQLRAKLQGSRTLTAAPSRVM